jgi:hypothetical protein
VIHSRKNPLKESIIAPIYNRQKTLLSSIYTGENKICGKRRKENLKDKSITQHLEKEEETGKRKSCYFKIKVCDNSERRRRGC